MVRHASALAVAIISVLLSNALLTAASDTSLKRSSTKIELGRALFFEKRLSADGTVSCATCHDPAVAFASKDAVAVGVNNQKGARNALTVLNSAFSKSYFWDGRALTLEQQAKLPLLHASEMGMNTEALLIERVAGIPQYQKGFRRVFPRTGITLQNIAAAIAAFERTLVSRNSPFDRFLNGDRSAITERQQEGWELFKGKAKCIDCHVHSTAFPFFSDNKFHNTGVRAKELTFETLVERAQEILAQSKQHQLDATVLAHNPQFSDVGRFLVTREQLDLGAFKTPTLRDVELTGPYMHDGSIRTLMDVVRFYNQGGVKNPRLDEKIVPLNLTEDELSKLVDFLRALTSDDVLRLVQTSKPQTRSVVR